MTTDIIKEKNEIVDYISKTIELTRSGKNFNGKCPFCKKEKSFVVYPETQSFYCFSCANGGDIITYCMKKENKTYREAVSYFEKLSEQATKTQESVNNLLNDVSKYLFYELKANYTNLLLKSVLEKWKITIEHATKLGLGYHDGKYLKIQSYMHDKLGYEVQDLIDFNLIGKNEKGSIFEKLRNSIIIPTIDLNKKVVCLDRYSLADGKVYYYPKSESFNRKEYVYSLNIASKSGYNSVILVSSYEDYFALYSQGFLNVVYTYLGKPSLEQMQLLKKYFKAVIIAVPSHFDYRPCIAFCRKNKMYADLIDMEDKNILEYFNEDKLISLKNKINEFNEVK